ncbi:MAG TPA: hypothetical protein GX499_03700 [Clostridiales bacterium]|nr:hypothetical protein [Clostridiales bacterium]
MSNSQQNQHCACPTKSCPRNGDCQACQAYHHSRGSLTRCEHDKQSAKKTSAS